METAPTNPVTEKTPVNIAKSASVEPKVLIWLATSKKGISEPFFVDNYNQKVDNPPAILECRPIKDFWAILKDKVYEDNWQAKDVKQQQTRIKLCLKLTLTLYFHFLGQLVLELAKSEETDWLKTNLIEINKKLKTLFNNIFI